MCSLTGKASNRWQNSNKLLPHQNAGEVLFKWGDDLSASAVTKLLYFDHVYFNSLSCNYIKRSSSFIFTMGIMNANMLFLIVCVFQLYPSTIKKMNVELFQDNIAKTYYFFLTPLHNKMWFLLQIIISTLWKLVFYNLISYSECRKMWK